MTSRLPFTQASVKRAIAAAQKAGLQIIGIRPDGTVMVNDGEKIEIDVSTALRVPPTAPAPSKWRD